MKQDRLKVKTFFVKTFFLPLLFSGIGNSDEIVDIGDSEVNTG